ncbi:MAG: tetratricopeptide repeat protein [Acidobacteriota bacterium]
MKLLAQKFAAEGRLVIFVGAGVSSIPPTCLPSWWAMNQAVTASLRDRVAELVGPLRAQVLAEAITQRQEANRFPPEYQAEVIVGRLRDSYFNVLQCLDSEIPNDVHLGIAALSKAHRVAAVVTTNFDRALEAAFRELHVPFEVWSNPAEFKALADRLDKLGTSVVPCPIIKLHGSAENPATLVDTLSQRKRGFAPAVAVCVRQLLRHAHWLFLGYSGADLMADENYLFLKPDAAQAQGFTWLLRTNEQPVAAVSATCAAYGSRAEIVNSELPNWLADFSHPLLAEPVPLVANLDTAAIDEVRRLGREKVAAHATAWAAAERFDRSVLVFADLLRAVGEPSGALDLVQRLYRRQPIEERKSRHFGVVVNTLANLYNEASRFDEAISLFREVLEIYDPTTAEEQHFGALSNLALVYEKQGKTDEALGAFERVLSFAERSTKAEARGIALHNIAMIRLRLGDADEAESLYREELGIVRALGDETARAIVLNNLGELEVSRWRFDRAVEYLAEAVSVRERLGDDLGAARTRANLANGHSLQGARELALELYEHSLDVFKRFGDRTDVARTLGNLARLNEDIGKRDEAIALLDETLTAAMAIGADPVRAQALRLRGEIQHKQGQLRDAFGTYQELVELTVRIRDAKGERDARVGRGIALKALNEIEPAIADLREAMALTELHEFPAREWVVDNLADALNIDGLAREHRGDLDGAMDDYLEALEIWRRRGLSYNEGQTLMNVANVQGRHKLYAEAADTLHRATAALLLGNDREGADTVALNSADVYLQLNRLNEASGVLREIVNRSTNYGERADRMNRIGALAEKQLQRGMIDRALRVFEDCARWNREDGYLPDAAACHLNLGSIYKAAGNVDGGRKSFEKALMLLADQPDHPLHVRAKSLLSDGAIEE